MATRTAPQRTVDDTVDEVAARRRSIARPEASRHAIEAAVAGVALCAAAVAVLVTARADHLTHPGWLAAQKADLILGPVLIGIYWRRRRPQSAFGNLLIAAGLLAVPYILHSASAPWAYAAGVLWERVLYLITLALILAFPSGRLEGAAARAIMAAAALFVTLPAAAAVLLEPELSAAASLSGCRPCVANGLLISARPDAADELLQLARVAILAIDIAAAGLLAWRLVAASAPRRHILTIGMALSLCFLASQFAYQLSRLVDAGDGGFETLAVWAVAVFRSTLWYGFLAALIAAQLYAARVLRRIVGETLRHPTFAELEAMLRTPVGDPGLRLLFWNGRSLTWSDAAGAAIGPPEPSPGRSVTEIRLDGAPAVAVAHDEQLDDEPELVHAAGAVALLARENAELEVAWGESQRVLQESRARIATARDLERRALERDLHDGVQQQLTAVVLRLAITREGLDPGGPAYRQIEGLELDLEEALAELRRLAHGIYPVPLAELGLVGALTAAAARASTPAAIHAEGVGRFPDAIEAAVYFCCLEAMQNATKHAGPDARVAIRLQTAGGELRFEVRDEGRGFDPAADHDGVGLRNIRDRLEAVHGRLEIVSAPGRGTVISGAVPVG
ncbi:MAG TPA: histidine kinase [Solirubrobacter sp.]|nr:histidine kinase [Solirubrobacter sp.]